jgi:HEAT repeat protein
VRRTAAYALGAIGPAARAAVPDLKEMLNAADRDQLTAVANALRSIDPNAVPGLRVDNVTN